MIPRLLQAADQRLGSTPFIRKALRYIFPDHWTFLLGEIALYSFIVLVATGIYLTLFFQPSYSDAVYTGSYAPLQGFTVSEAYLSTVGLSLDVPAGLVIRQAHHWAALVFVVAIVVHLMRIFFTGAFRKPRDINYLIGITLLVLAILEGFAGYSLPDDLLSGMGLAIAYGVCLSIPGIGAQLAYLIWGAQFPGSESFEPRLYIVHVLIVPVIIAVLISVHLAIITRQKHSQFPGRGRTERNVVGTPMWPAYALRSVGLLFAVGAAMLLLGGLVQINPVWQWGPFEPYLGTNGAQPDWYMGWLIGALRLMPSFEPHPFNITIAGNPFFGGVVFPGFIFLVLYLWPSLERRITKDRRRHDLLDRPRDRPWRTALGAAFFSWVFTIFVAGASDRILVSVGIPYEAQVRFFRVAAFLIPIIVFFVARAICRELQRTELHPLRGFVGTRVTQRPTGGFDTEQSQSERSSR